MRKAFGLGTNFLARFNKLASPKYITGDKAKLASRITDGRSAPQVGMMDTDSLHSIIVLINTVKPLFYNIELNNSPKAFIRKTRTGKMCIPCMIGVVYIASKHKPPRLIITIIIYFFVMIVDFIIFDFETSTLSKLFFLFVPEFA